MRIMPIIILLLLKLRIVTVHVCAYATALNNDDDTAFDDEHGGTTHTA